MSGETCFRKNTVRASVCRRWPHGISKYGLFFEIFQCFRAVDRMCPTVGQVSSSGQLPQVAAPRFKAHWRMPQRWSQNTVLTPSVRQPWPVDMFLAGWGRCSIQPTVLRSFPAGAWSLWSVARYASHAAQFSRSKRSDHPWLYPPELFGDSVLLPFGAYETVGLSRPDAGRPDWRGRPWPASAPAPPRRW